MQEECKTVRWRKEKWIKRERQELGDREGKNKWKEQKRARGRVCEMEKVRGRKKEG